MAKPKFRDIKIQRNGKFNTDGTVHDIVEEAFAYWDRKLPNNETTYLIFPNEVFPENGIEVDCSIMCFSLDFAKKCLGV